MEITFVKNDEFILPKKFINSWLKELIKELQKEKKLKNKVFLKADEISLVFLKSSQIKKINKEYRGKDKATDVLSFDGDGVHSVGELLFCHKIIKKKASELKYPTRLYLCFLMTHGFLHLLGYEHESSAQDEKLMFSLQNKVFRKVAAKLAPKSKNDFDIDLTH